MGPASTRWTSWLGLRGLCGDASTTRTATWDEAEVLGCTNLLATNYSAEATDEDGSYLIEGCTDTEADNSIPAAPTSTTGPACTAARTPRPTTTTPGRTPTTVPVCTSAARTPSRQLGCCQPDDGSQFVGCRTPRPTTSMLGPTPTTCPACTSVARRRGRLLPGPTPTTGPACTSAARTPRPTTSMLGTRRRVPPVLRRTDAEADNLMPAPTSRTAPASTSVAFDRRPTTTPRPTSKTAPALPGLHRSVCRQLRRGRQPRGRLLPVSRLHGRHGHQLR